jgi:hypothetical protein
VSQWTREAPPVPVGVEVGLDEVDAEALGVLIA